MQAAPLHADSCITLKPASGTTRISVNDNKEAVTIRVVGPVHVSGDTAPYSVSGSAGVVVWKATLPSEVTLSTSRAGGVVKVCQMGAVEPAIAQAAQPQSSAPATPTASNPAPAATTPAASAQTSAGQAPTQGATNAATAAPPQPPSSVAQNQSVSTSIGGSAPADKLAQKQLNDPKNVVVAGVERALKAGELPSAQTRFAHDFAPYILYIAKPTISRRILSDAEEKRIDEQVAATQPSAGTSVTSKGSVPWLLGFAAESGALTQSRSNNLLTFNGTPANIVKALKARDYLTSYDVGKKTPLVNWLFTPLSFSVSINSSQSGASTGMAPPPGTSTQAPDGTLAGFTLRYNIWNHRDARDPRYRKTWADFVDANAQPMLKAVSRLVESLARDPKYKDAFAQWQIDSQAAITRTDMTPDEIGKAFEDRAEALRKIVGNDAVLRGLVDDAAQSIETYADTRNKILTDISNTTAVAFEYTETQQKNLLGGPLMVTNSNPSGTNDVPNLSTFNFIIEKGSVGRSQFTANASTTIFNTIPKGTRVGRVRDYRAAVETDIPLPEIKGAGMPVLSFSGLFVGLVNQPLGEKVVINDVPESLRGNIWLFQSKLSLKIKDTGVKVPVAFTYANRTELNKEADKRGSIGVTYNLDNLFASGK